MFPKLLMLFLFDVVEVNATFILFQVRISSKYFLVILKGFLHEKTNDKKKAMCIIICLHQIKEPGKTSDAPSKNEFRERHCKRCSKVI